MPGTCGIARAGGPLVVRLRANNVLQTGASFAVWSAAGTALERWDASAGVEGHSDHTVQAPSDQLDQGYLTWRIVVCSHDPNIVSGAVDVIVLQDGATCATTPPAHYDLAGIPACETGQVIPITDERKLVAG